MPLIRIAMIAAAAALASATAYAQTTSADTTTAPQTPPAADSAPAPTADTTAPAPVAIAQNDAATGVTVTQTGGVQVIAAQPVPDTPANRAKYGAPMSHAGRRTAPTGN